MAKKTKGGVATQDVASTKQVSVEHKDGTTEAVFERDVDGEKGTTRAVFEEGEPRDADA